MRLLLFNPETDLALATDTAYYTPPKRIVELRRRLALLPSLYAGAGDALLLPEGSCNTDSQLSSIIREKRLRLVSSADLSALEFSEVIPWGWNRSLVTALVNAGVSPRLLPDDESMERLRDMSHRRLTIKVFSKLNDYGIYLPPAPRELFSVEECMGFASENRISYFKAPWSSSGHGVIRIRRPFRREDFNHVGGIIRSQGSIMAEKGVERAVDFASEWSCRDGVVSFEGWSLFTTTGKGGYIDNVVAPQPILLQMISAYAPEANSYIEPLRMIISEFIAPFYDGPVGIDMLADSDGNVNPCVEVNLRMTMGMCALYAARQRHNGLLSSLL